MLGLGAWAARNHERLGSVVILTTNLGTHNAPFFGIDRARIVESGRRQGLNEAEINDALVAEIGRAAAAAPAWAAWLYVQRALDLFSLGRPWEVRALLATRTFAAPDGSPGAHRAYGALLFQYYLTYPLALAGAILLRARAAAPPRRVGDPAELRPGPRRGVRRELPAGRAALSRSSACSPDTPSPGSARGADGGPIDSPEPACLNRPVSRHRRPPVSAASPGEGSVNGMASECRGARDRAASARAQPA